MKTSTVATIIVLSIVAIISMVGCMSFAEVLTPAKVDAKAVEYTGNEPNEYQSFVWPNYGDAKKLEADVTSKHQLNVLAWEQKIEADQLKYSQIKAVVTANRVAAAEFEEKIFGEDGFVGIGLSALGFGSVGGLLGLMRKRPQDVTPEELKALLIEAGIKDPEKFKEEQGLS